MVLRRSLFCLMTIFLIQPSFASGSSNWDDPEVQAYFYAAQPETKRITIQGQVDPTDPNHWPLKISSKSKEILVKEILVRAALTRAKNNRMFIALSLYLLEVPPQLETFAHLTEVDLTDNDLTAFPEVLCKLPELEVLYLNNNSITQIPISIGQLTSLTSLSINNNKIRDVSLKIGKLVRLRSLFASNNLISELPESIYCCMALYEMNLSFNSLKRLPGTIGGLTNLIELECSQNPELRTWPDTFSNLFSLRYLRAASCDFSRFPDHMERLTSLRSINLDRNDVQVVPRAILQLTQLQYLILAENPLLTIKDSTVELLKVLGKSVKDYPEITEDMQNNSVVVAILRDKKVSVVLDKQGIEPKK